MTPTIQWTYTVQTFDGEVLATGLTQQQLLASIDKWDPNTTRVIETPIPTDD